MHWMPNLLGATADGDRADYLRTIVRLACEREDLGPGLREWLEVYVAKGFTD